MTQTNTQQEIKKIQTWIKQHDCKHEDVAFHAVFSDLGGIWTRYKECDDCGKRLQTYDNKYDYVVDFVKYELDIIKRKIKGEFAFGNARYIECKEAIKKLYKEL